MKVAVTRMLKRAQALMDNAAVGVFPCMQPLAEPIVWRNLQRQAMAEAVARGEWRPLFEHTRPLKVQLRDDDDLLSP